MTAKNIVLTMFVLILLSSSLASGEISIIQNPQKAPKTREIPMEEVWCIGDDPGAEYILGIIKMVISDEEGNFYLLDIQQKEVFKFSPDGQYLQSVSRKGEGPGEIERCNFFGFWDENTIACFNNFPHKFVRFDLEGIPVETLTPTAGEAQKDDGRMAMSKFIRRDGFLVAHGSFFLFKDGNSTQKFFLSGYDEMAQETVCYGTVPTGYDRSKPIVVDEKKDFIPLRRWTLGVNGEVYIAPHRTEYLIEVYDAQGNLLRKITRPWPLNKLTSEEKEDAKSQYSLGFSGPNAPEVSYRIADYPQIIKGLSWVDGQLWVTTLEAEEEAGKYSVDIFNQEGQLLEKRSYQLPMDPQNDRVHWLEGGRAVVVTNYESARVAGRSSNTTFVRGDGESEKTFDKGILEVILYKAK